MPLFDPAIPLEFGLPGLAVVTFAAATLLPFSSEVAVLGALAAGWPPWSVFVWASVGNSAGASFDFLLGRWLAVPIRQRLDRSTSGRHALRWAERFGPWSLLLSWVPVVGDPVLFAAGVVGVRWPAVVVLGLGTRVARYALIVRAVGLASDVGVN